MLMVPWLCRPMMSPAQASSACWRSAAMKVSASAIRTSLPSRTWSRRMPRRYAARADAQERDAVAVAGIHVRLDLEHEAGQRRLRAARPRASSPGARAAPARARRRSAAVPRRRSSRSRSRRTPASAGRPGRPPGRTPASRRWISSISSRNVRGALAEEFRRPRRSRALRSRGWCRRGRCARRRRRRCGPRRGDRCRAARGPCRSAR